MSTEKTLTSTKQPSQAWKWLLSGGLVAAMGVIAIGVLIVSLALTGGLKRLTGGGSTRIVRVIDTHHIEDVLKENKYVPLTVITTVEINRSDTYKSWGVYWGTNVAQVRATGVRLQYMMDMGELQTSDITVDAASVPARVIIFAPTPRVDENMVVIDPLGIETSVNGGWMRWDKAKTLTDAIGDLKSRAIVQAKKEYLLDAAKAQGKKNIEGLLRAAAGPSDKPYDIEVYFH